MNWYSQSGQDAWVLQHKLTGFYVDIGAYDGVESSNTYALEQRGWKGICIEANVNAFAGMDNVRKSLNINIAVNDYSGVCTFAGDRIGPGYSVPCGTLTDILDKAGCPLQIDYMSIDIEGKEYDILKAFDFSRYSVGLLTVEHNLYCEGPANKDRLHKLLTNSGFTRVVEDAKCLDPNPAWYGQPYEDWYQKL